MEFVILGAAAVLMASYLIPLIITCVVGAVTIVVTFVATRAFYKKKKEQETEMENSKKQQMERDHAIHEEVSKIALETGIDMQTLIKLSKEQQAELKYTILEFMKNIEESDTATKNLASIANTIQEATNNATLQNTDLHQELERMKNELIQVYSKLSNTEKALAHKEAELKITIDQLTDLGDKIVQSGILAQLDNIQNLQQEYTKLYPSAEELSAKNSEIISLRAKNITFSKTIDSLNRTITELQTRLDDRSENEKNQIQEIQKLIADNKLLTETIESLTESMEEQNIKATKITQNNSSQFRMFK